MVRTLLPLLLDGSGSIRRASGSLSTSFRPAHLDTVPPPHVVCPMRPVNLFHQVTVLQCTTKEPASPLGNKLGNKQTGTKPHQAPLSRQTHERGTPNQHQAALTGHIFVG